MPERDPADGTSLRRTIGPVQMTLYGLGSMLGSGIYGLIGQAAGEAGNAVWLSFIVAMVAALLTALSYAALGSRHPRAGGAAYVAQRAYRWPLVSFVVGLAMVCSGLASVATQARIFAANLAEVLGVPALSTTALAIGFVLILAGIVFRGIRESMWVNATCTIVEAAGLIVVIAVGASFWGSVDYLETPAERATTSIVILQGTVLTFFAFIGFEDTLNVAEECRKPERTIPIGLLSALAVATILYVAVAVTAVSVVPWQDLAEAPAPLTEVIERAAPWFPAAMFTAVTLFAVSNTALVNYVTASRLLYGMSRQGLLPSRLGDVHERQRTPHIAIALLLVVVIPLAAFGGIGELASATVLLLLVVFALVNGALVVLMRRPGEARGRFEVPLFVPALGSLVCAALVVVRTATGDWRAPAIAATLLAGILVAYAVRRPKAARQDA